MARSILLDVNITGILWKKKILTAIAKAKVNHDTDGAFSHNLEAFKTWSCVFQSSLCILKNHLTVFIEMY